MTTTQSNGSFADSHLKTIMDLLAEVLCIERESLNPKADFADLGLDSVLSVEFAARLRATFDVQLRAADLYKHGTPSALAASLDG
jgi:acyl carrier protein